MDSRNTVPDACETVGAGDLDADGDEAPPPGCSPYHFDNGDLDADGDVDLMDCGEFQRGSRG